ncbi:hypothetical protein V2J09_020878 [Rumex salicifolius]
MVVINIISTILRDFWCTMGCILAKPSTLEEDTQRDIATDISISEYDVSREIAERREGSSVLDDSYGTARSFLIEKKSSGSIGYRDDHSQKNVVKLEDVFSNNLNTISVVPKSREGEQIAAGWPSWLVSVAGEALCGWVPRNADTFEKLDKIGQGTYSSVYKAQDLIHSKLVALKRVRFDNLDRESVNFMAREIIILRRLDHPNIIKLEGVIASPASSSLYLIFEYMEHDLTGLASIPEIRFTEPQVKCYMKQLLSGLEHCHSRGVLHRDIKGSNLLIDNSGILKIADFGLASFYDPVKNLPMTSRVVTLWYRPPELLLGAIYYNEAVDMWSTGCILGELYFGKPLMPGRTEYFTTEPLACDPSSLPKYPPSKEIDVKMREEEKKRCDAVEGRGTGDVPSSRQRPEHYEAALADKASANLVASVQMQERKRQSFLTSRNQTFNSYVEQPARPRNPETAKQVGKEIFDQLRLRGLHTGPLTHGDPWPNTGKRAHDPLITPRDSKPVTPSTTSASTRARLAKNHGPVGPSIYTDPTRRPGRLPGSSNELDPSRNYDRRYHSQSNVYSNQREDKAFVSRPTMNNNMNGYGSSEEYKMQYSGPLMNNVDEMMRDRDRRIQEAARRSRVDKPNQTRLGASLLLPVYRR